MEPEPANTSFKARFKRGGAILLVAFASLTLLVFICRELGCFGASAAVARGPGPKSTRSDQTTAYYLHGNRQCANCKTMSALAEKVLAQHFGPELKNGNLNFKIENYDLPGNEFFRRECQVVSPTVLLVEYRQGQAVRWTNLAGIWEYPSDQETAYYLQKETGVFLTANSATPMPPQPSAPTGKAGWWLAITSAFGMGLLAAISPCALATNAVALSFLSRCVTRSRRVLWRGAGYSAGRMLAYMALGVILVSGLLSVSTGGYFLIKYINSLLGPVLIFMSLFLLQWVRWNWSLPVSVEGWQARAESGGIGAALLLGVVLALAFCPMSAALFFGGLLPLAVKTQSSLLLPASFGLATGLPVVVFAVLISLASRAADHWFKRLRQLETYLRLAMALAFLGAGIYYSLLYVFHLW